MRVTDAATFSAMNKRLSQARTDVAEAQDRASTGLRVAKPSDDPVAFAAARRENAKKALADAGLRAGDLATTHLTGADDALAMATDAISRAKELALSGGSSTMGADQRRGLAEEVRQLRDQMVTLGNTQVAGSYVFAGYADDRPAFDSTGQFVGDSNVREVSTYPGLKASAALPGEIAFGEAGGPNVFATLDALAAALEANDEVAVRATIGDLDNDERRMISGRSRLGAMMDGVDTARSVADRYGYSAQLEAARLTEADQVSAVTDLLKAQSALEAALAVAQQMPTGGMLKKV